MAEAEQAVADCNWILKWSIKTLRISVEDILLTIADS